MTTIGIIAEFNPFHNGHFYLLQEARKQNQGSGIICVMSGNFLQRGEPALCNKWVRAQMALESGADLVIELPFCYSVRSAYYFARGAIQLLEQTGVVTHLAFGSESGNLDELQAISSVIAHERPPYQQTLKSFLAQGLSFPSARSKTLQEILGHSIPSLEEIILQPNNILALEYLRILEQEAIQISPLTISRRGSAYNSTELSPLASASAIRFSLLNNENSESIAESMPASSFALLEQEIGSGRAPVTLGPMEQSMLFKLRTLPRETLGNIYEISEGLENRIQKAAISCGTLEELRYAVKSKRYSLTRINRILLYTLMDVYAQQIKSFDEAGPQYLHILGFSALGQKILQEIKINSKIRILSRGSDVKDTHTDQREPMRSSMLDLDIRASNLYTLLYPNPLQRRGDTDFTSSPIRLSDSSE